MASIGTQLTEAFAGLDRIREILETPAEDAEDAAKSPLGPVGGEWQFEHVWFEYREGLPVLRGHRLHSASRGQRRLVGSSGSGKST
jgi:subfamily B ATP-binding cassette protein MsbA